MKVLLATDSPSPSGVGEHMLTLAAALPPGMAALAFPDHDAGRALADRARAAGLRADTLAAVETLVATTAAQIVHVHAGIGWEGHALVRAAAGRAVIRTEHLPWLLTDPGQIAEYLDAARGVDAVIAVSQAARGGWDAALSGLGATRPQVHAVQNGIRPPMVHHVGAGAAELLCVGRFTPQKRHRTLLAAMRRLMAQGIDARLSLIGDGPGLAAARRNVGRLGIADRVVFLGRRDDVPERMAAADLLVLPSAFEGLPLVVLEAMAIGLPVVATDIGGAREALGDGYPWLVMPGQSRALADGIAQALSDTSARRATAQQAQARWAQNFTAAQMAASTLRIYRGVFPHQRKDGMAKIKVGFVGAGGIAHRHFGVLQTMPDVQIKALAEPDPDRAAHAAQVTGAAAYPDHDAMLGAEHLDAVFICVPPFAHGPAERACIARNIPFLVEKPLSVDIELAQDIAAQVDLAGLVTAVGYHWRYLDTMDEARAHLAQNPAHLMQGFWLDQTPPPRWWWDEDACGGQLVEQATHVIDAARFLAGDVTEVFGMVARRDRADFNGLTVPTATAATLRFASGAIANLSATCLLRWNHRVGLHVFADGLALEITDHDLMVDCGQGRPVRAAQGDPVWRQDRDFLDAAIGGENRIRCPYPEALKTHRIALNIARSAREGALVTTEVLRADPQPIFRQAAAQGPDHAA